MASINRSQDSEDRKTDGGKGDLYKTGQSQYRKASIWGVTKCCGVGFMRINGKRVCEQCQKAT